jgi:glyoxylase-like metal-dependent hydrolase (beta-lactamase superfamily II)
MIFRQLFDKESSTYTYLLGCESTKSAVLIDPVKEQVERDLKLLEELGLTLQLVLDTHVHADHITAAGELRERTSCDTGVSVQCEVGCANLQLSQGQTLKVGEISIQVLETPGHTNGCLSYLVGDMVFTGDALLIRGCGRTDFQGGDAGRLFDSVTKKLFSLPDNTRVYPAHDYRGNTMSTIAEEKASNPRLTKNREEFIVFMSSLRLEQPRKIMEALPANLNCGNVLTTVRS